MYICNSLYNRKMSPKTIKKVFIKKGKERIYNLLTNRETNRYILNKILKGNLNNNIKISAFINGERLDYETNNFEINNFSGKSLKIENISSTIMAEKIKDKINGCT